MTKAVCGWLSCLGLVLACTAASAEEKAAEAPQEAHVRMALRALEQVASGEDEDVRVEIGARYVDAAGLLERVGNAPASWRTPASIRAVAQMLVRPGLALVAGASREAEAEPRYTARGRFAVLALDEDRAVAWSQGPRGPLVADLRVKGQWVSEQLRARFVEQPETQPPGALKRQTQITISKDNIRSILVLLIARRSGAVAGRWPRYSGKNFVLGIVASRDLDIRSAENRELLFSPAGPKARPGKRRFEEVTKASLKEAGAFSALTHYAGRRNANREFLITPDQEAQGTPLLADLHFDGIAIVGFSTGEVRVMDRKALGLGPKDPIICGDDSKSELLQKLSDR